MTACIFVLQGPVTEEKKGKKELHMTHLGDYYFGQKTQASTFHKPPFRSSSFLTFIFLVYCKYSVKIIFYENLIARRVFGKNLYS